jgi:hypothetical protein
MRILYNGDVRTEQLIYEHTMGLALIWLMGSIYFDDKFLVL